MAEFKATLPVKLSLKKDYLLNKKNLKLSVKTY